MKNTITNNLYALLAVAAYIANLLVEVINKKVNSVTLSNISNYLKKI